MFDLTNEEFYALDTLLGLVNAYRLGYLSDAFFAAGVLLFLSEYGRGDLLNKVANSHKFGSIYFGMLHISDGWNAYDRSLHPGF